MLIDPEKPLYRDSYSKRFGNIFRTHTLASLQEVRTTVIYIAISAPSYSEVVTNTVNSICSVASRNTSLQGPHYTAHCFRHPYTWIMRGVLRRGYHNRATRSSIYGGHAMNGSIYTTQAIQKYSAGSPVASGRGRRTRLFLIHYAGLLARRSVGNLLLEPFSSKMFPTLRRAGSPA